MSDIGPKGHHDKGGPNVVRTTTSPLSPRTVLVGLGVGAVLAAAATGLVLSHGSPAHAQGDVSSAFGASVSGVENKAGQPAVSSGGEVKTGSGTASGMGWSATGITVKAGAGLAEATVANVTAGGRAIGSVSAKCVDGVTTYGHSGAEINEEKFKVTFRGGAGATIRIFGAGEEPVQTITVAVVKCAKGIPSPTTPPTTTPPTPEPTGEPTGRPTGQPTSTPSETSKPTDKPVPPAPKPQPQNDHHPVTG